TSPPSPPLSPRSPPPSSERSARLQLQVPVDRVHRQRLRPRQERADAVALQLPRDLALLHLQPLRERLHVDVLLPLGLVVEQLAQPRVLEEHDDEPVQLRDPAEVRELALEPVARLEVGEEQHEAALAERVL